MAIIRSGWVLRPQTVMVLQPLTSQPSLHGCHQLIVGLTYSRGGTLDILITDVPDLVRVAIVSPTGNSDYSALSAVISMAQAVSNFCVSKKIFLKHQVNWNTVWDAVQDFLWPKIWFAMRF